MTPRGLPRNAAIAGAAVMVVWFVGWLFSPEHAMRAYLFAWLLALGAALGAMSILMLHHLTGGAWGVPVRRPAEAAAMTLPLLALLFVPVALQPHRLFPWADAQLVSEHAILKHRYVAFATGFTLFRAAAYFAAWSLLAWRLRTLSLKHDRTRDGRLLDRMRRTSAIGLIVYFVTMSLAAVDWIASREVDWYSSTFGWGVIVGQATTGIALLVVVLAVLRRHRPIDVPIEPDRVHDLGNLLLTVVVLWAYIAFAQLLVIWMGNTQEDVTWYTHRTAGGWWWVAAMLIVLHFAVPFVMLLSRRVKRDIRVLSAVAGGVLVMRGIDLLWMIAPSSLGEHAAGVYWTDFVAPVGIGGLWIAAFSWLLLRRPLAPAGTVARIESSHYDTGRTGQSAV